MGTHMKTTIEIAPALMLRAKQVAAREKITLRELVEAGLRAVLNERKTEAFALRDARVGGKGLSDEFQDGSWARVRDTVYLGRGS
jgi:Arc/MetJ family transcription regulator